MCQYFFLYIFFQKFDKILLGFVFSLNSKSNIFQAFRLENMFDYELVEVHVDRKSDQKRKLNALLSKVNLLKIH